MPSTRGASNRSSCARTATVLVSSRLSTANSRIPMLERLIIVGGAATPGICKRALSYDRLAL